MTTITFKEGVPLYLLTVIGEGLNYSRLVQYDRLLDEISAALYGDYVATLDEIHKEEFGILGVSLEDPENWIMAEDSNGADVCFQYQLKNDTGTITITRVMDYSAAPNEYISFHGGV